MENKAWTMTLLAVISAARIGMGIYNSLPGPTLMYLAENVNVSFAAISTVFTARFVGILFGSILGGVVKRVLGPTCQHLFTLGIGVGAFGLTELAIPWVRRFPLLLTVVVFGGIMYGYVDAGLQALLLRLLGEKSSRPYIQLFHFMYSVGTFIGPFLASPFLMMVSSGDTSEDRCPFSDKDLKSQVIPGDASISGNITINNHADEHIELGFNPIGWGYVIEASWLVTVSCTMVLLSFLNVESRVAKSMTKSGSTCEKRKDEPFQDVKRLLGIIIAFYFCCVTVGSVFCNFIYSVTLCSGFEPASASLINSLYYAGVGVGRFTGVIVSNFMKPRTIITFCIVGSITDMAVMCIWGRQIPWIAWSVAPIHGYTTSVLIPTGVSWLSQYTNVSGMYIFVFNVGSACGSMSMLPLAGYLFEQNPFNVMYLVLALSIGDAITFIIAMFVAIKHKKYLEGRSRLDDSNVNTKLTENIRAE